MLGCARNSTQHLVGKPQRAGESRCHAGGEPDGAEFPTHSGRVSEPRARDEAAKTAEAPPTEAGISVGRILSTDEITGGCHQQVADAPRGERKDREGLRHFCLFHIRLIQVCRILSVLASPSVRALWEPFPRAHKELGKKLKRLDFVARRLQQNLRSNWSAISHDRVVGATRS